MNTKVEYFFKKKTKVHICCWDNIFYNGKIISLESKKWFLILMDDKLGEIPVMFEDINRIEPYVKDGDKDDRKG